MIWFNRYTFYSWCCACCLGNSKTTSLDRNIAINLFALELRDGKTSSNSENYGAILEHISYMVYLFHGLSYCCNPYVIIGDSEFSNHNLTIL